MSKIKCLLFLFKHKKEAKYIRKTWNIPLYWCKDFLKTWNCKHIEEARLLFNKLIKWVKYVKTVDE